MRHLDLYKNYAINIKAEREAKKDAVSLVSGILIENQEKERRQKEALRKERHKAVQQRLDHLIRRINSYLTLAKEKISPNHEYLMSLLGQKIFRTFLTQNQKSIHFAEEVENELSQLIEAVQDAESQHSGPRLLEKEKITTLGELLRWKELASQYLSLLKTDQLRDFNRINYIDDRYSGREIRNIPIRVVEVLGKISQRMTERRELMAQLFLFLDEQKNTYEPIVSLSNPEKIGMRHKISKSFLLEKIRSFKDVKSQKIQMALEILSSYPDILEMGDLKKFAKELINSQLATGLSVLDVIERLSVREDQIIDNDEDGVNQIETSVASTLG